MENQKNDNLNLLEAVVQNTEMGKNTLEQIVPMTEDPAFRAELCLLYTSISFCSTTLLSRRASAAVL